MKTLGIVGYSGIDVTMYIATALRNIGHKVAIRDKSPNAELLHILLPDDATEDNADYCGMSVFVQKKDIPGDADFLILYYGAYTESEQIPSHDYVFMTTDMFPKHAKALAKCTQTYQKLHTEKNNVKKSSSTTSVSEGDNKKIKVNAKKKRKKENKVPPFRLENGEPLFVINHYINHKYGEKYLLSISELGVSRKSVCILPFNINDYKTLLNIGHEKFTLSSLSENYKMFIQKAVLLLTGTDLTKKQRKILFK